MHELPSGGVGRHIESEWVERTLEESAALFVSQVRSLKPGGNILIFESDADPRFFNSEVVATLREAKHRRDAHISVITGPVIAVDDESVTNGLLELTREGVIDEFRHRPTNYADSFFWLVETKYGYEYQPWRPVPSAQP